MTPMLVIFAIVASFVFIFYYIENREATEWTDAWEILKLAAIIYVPTVVIFYGAYFLYEMYFQ